MVLLLTNGCKKIFLNFFKLLSQINLTFFLEPLSIQKGETDPGKTPKTQIISL